MGNLAASCTKIGFTYSLAGTATLRGVERCADLIDVLTTLPSAKCKHLDALYFNRA